MVSKADMGDEMPAAGTKQQIVLVVDGKPMRQFYTSIFLQRLRYHVIMAKSGEDALIFLGLTVPLIIIVNIDLPQMSGLDLLKQVKHDRRTRDVPVLIYTSNKDPELKRTCEQAGCAGFLRHPASLDQLYSAVQMATNKPRRFVRLTTALDVIVEEGDRSGGGDNKDCITMISELGVFVSTGDPPSYGTVLPLSFHLPNAPGWVIRVEGQVVYRNLSKELRKRPGMGVKFMKIGAQEREFIKDFIKEQLMEGLLAE